MCPPTFFRPSHAVHALQTHKALVLLLTFWCYACFHASRKPLSVVKSVLTGENNATLTYWAAYDPSPLDPGAQSASGPNGRAV